MNEFKAPWVEDYEYCYEKNRHLFIQNNDGIMKCYICHIDFKDFRKKND